MQRISVRIIGAILFSSVALTLVLGLVSIRKSTNYIGVEAEQHLLSEARSLANSLNVSIRSHESTTETLHAMIASSYAGKRWPCDPESRRVLGDTLKKTGESIPYCVAAYVWFDPSYSGTPQVISFGIQENSRRFEPLPNPPPEMFNPNRSDMRWYYDPIERGKGVWSSPYYWPRMKRTLITYATPVFIGRQLIGVVGMDLDFDLFTTSINRISLYENGHAFMLDQNYHFIVRPQSHSVDGHIGWDSAAYQQYLQSHPSLPAGLIPRISQNGVEEISAFARLTNGFIVVVSVPENEVFAEVSRLNNVMAVLMLLVLVVSVLLAYGLGRRIALPIESASKYAEILARGDSSVSLSDELLMRNDEIGQIGQSLKELLEKHTQEMRASHMEMIYRLSQAGEFRDKYTGSHVVRVGRASALLAKLAGFDDELVERMLLATPMHDIGKIGVPDAILRKEGPLEPEEWIVMKKHSEIGGEILKNGSSALLETAYLIARNHHERWDGTGYPEGLSGKDIPIPARICAVIDAFDAMTSPRSYKKAMSCEQAIVEIRAHAGTQFDPALADVFLENSHIIIELQSMEITSWDYAQFRPLLNRLAAGSKSSKS